jgi:hypothetical protein
MLRLTTTKEGVNKGRKFFKCGNNGQCQFFKWSDDDGKKKSKKQILLNLFFFSLIKNK